VLDSDYTIGRVFLKDQTRDPIQAGIVNLENGLILMDGFGALGLGLLATNALSCYT
jgi:hypothetical protein